MKESEEEDKFAEEWRKAFEDAELSPSPVVWSEIENRLDAKSGWKSFGNIVIKAFVSLFLMLAVLTGYHNMYVSQQAVQTKKQTFETRVLKKQNSSPELNKEKFFKDNKPENNTQLQALSEDTTVLNSKLKQITQPKITHQHNVVSQNTSNKPPVESRNGQKLVVFPSPQRQTVVLNKEKEPINPIQVREQISTDEALKLVPLQYLAYKSLVNYAKNESHNLNSRLDSNALILLQNNVKVRQTSRLSLEMAFTPAITNFNQQLDYEGYLRDYLHLHNIQNVNIDSFFVDLRENVTHKSAFYVSAKLMYVLKARLKLRAGITYHASQTQLKTNALFINEQNEAMLVLSNQVNREDINNVSIARIITTNPSYNPNTYHSISLNNYNDAKSILLNQRTQYLKIPLEIGNTFSLGRNFSHTLWAGINFDLLLGSTTHYTALSNLITKVNAHKTLNTSVSLRWQGNYHLNKKWTIFVEPFYEKGVGNFAKSGKYLRISPQSYGIGLGINRKL